MPTNLASNALDVAMPTDVADRVPGASLGHTADAAGEEILRPSQTGKGPISHAHGSKAIVRQIRWEPVKKTGKLGVSASKTVALSL